MHGSSHSWGNNLSYLGNARICLTRCGFTGHLVHFISTRMLYFEQCGSSHMDPSIGSNMDMRKAKTLLCVMGPLPVFLYLVSYTYGLLGVECL